MADYGRFSPAQIDFGWLSELPEQFEKGSLYGRQRKLRNTLGTDEAKTALAEGNFGKLASIVAQYDPDMATKLMDQGYGGSSNPYGANFYYGLKTDPATGKQVYTLMAPDKRSGQLTESQLPPGVDSVAGPQRWFEGMQGPFSVPAKGPYSGGGQPQQPMQISPGGEGPQPGVGPDGTDPGGEPQPAAPEAAQPGRQQTIGSVKANQDFNEQKSTAYAITSDTALHYNKLQSNIDQILKNDEGLTNLTGNYKPGGFDTTIPSAKVPNWQQSTRNAKANLETIKTEIGLIALAGMRAASAQGASGMGQLAIQESLWLQGSVETLDELQDPQQIKAHLAEIRIHVDKLKSIIGTKFKMTYGEDFGNMDIGGQGNTAPPAPGGGQPNYIDHGNGVREIVR